MADEGCKFYKSVSKTKSAKMIKYLEIIYNKLPYQLQNLAISLYGYYWRQRRLGGIFKEEVKNALNRESFTSEEWAKYHESLLRKMLVHAYNNVPFYSKSFRDSNLGITDLQNFKLGDINKLGLVDKSTYRELGTTEMMSKKKDPNGSFFVSSGSTGTPTNTYYSFKMHQKYFAIFEVTVNYWANIDYSVARGTFGPRRIISGAHSSGPHYRYNRAEKQVYFSAFHVSRETVRDYLEGLHKYKVQYMTGYCMSNFFLARFIEEEGLTAPKLKAVLTSSEKLTDEIRDTFRRVYGCETFDSYNGVEACNLISECEYHSLHVVNDVGITEILKTDGTQCLPGETGEIVCTSLINFDQPLIRYRMGDLVSLSVNQNCECGRSLPVVEEIVGRIMDTVYGKDGREMAQFYKITTNILSIKESQIIQHTLDDIEIKLVLSKPLNPDEEATIRTRIASQLGDVNLKITDGNEIEKGPNGKFKSVISHIKRPSNRISG